MLPSCSCRSACSVKFVHLELAYSHIYLVVRTPSQDDVHEGFHIAKGTIVIVNFWYVSKVYPLRLTCDRCERRGMLHDKNVFSNPDSFMPERWLDQKMLDKAIDPWEISFGFGRR